MQTSAIGPFVMKILLPLSTQSSPSRTAVVSRPAGIGPGLGLGRRPRADHRPVGEPGQPALLLRLGAVQPDRHRSDHPVRAEGQVEAAVVAALGDRLVGDDAVHDRRAGAAVLLRDRQAGQPLRAERLPDLGVPAALLVAIARAGRDRGRGPVVDAAAERLLLVGQGKVHARSVPAWSRRATADVRANVRPCRRSRSTSRRGLGSTRSSSAWPRRDALPGEDGDVYLDEEGTPIARREAGRIVALQPSSWQRPGRCRQRPPPVVVADRRPDPGRTAAASGALLLLPRPACDPTTPGTSPGRGPGRRPRQKSCRSRSSPRRPPAARPSSPRHTPPARCSTSRPSLSRPARVGRSS